MAEKVSFTADIWSDDAYSPYLAIPAHWIALKGNSLKMKALLIAFHYFPSSHTGEAITKTILELLDWVEVTLKVHDYSVKCISYYMDKLYLGWSLYYG